MRLVDKKYFLPPSSLIVCVSRYFAPDGQDRLRVGVIHVSPVYKSGFIRASEYIVSVPYPAELNILSDVTFMIQNFVQQKSG